MPDLSALWQQHTDQEFVTRNTEATLDTMVEDAYVNHVPVMTGGRGKEALRAFYSRDFIPRDAARHNPDTRVAHHW